MSIQAHDLDITAKRPLRCIVPECPGSPFAPHGYHLVYAIKPDEPESHTKPQGLGNASAFTCTEHLPTVEDAVAHYCEDRAAESWAVQTYRMYGWEDDGRGSAYISASGDPAALF